MIFNNMATGKVSTHLTQVLLHVSIEIPTSFLAYDCLVGNHFLSQITKFETHSLFKYPVINELKSKFGVYTT